MEASVPARPRLEPEWLAAVAISLAALVLYVATLAPGLMWGDDAELQRFALVGGTRADAHMHPFWLWAATLIARLPLGEPAWRVNLTSAVFAAITVGLVYLIAVRLTRRRGAASLAALAFAVSHTLWLHAVRTEVYSVFTAFMALTLFVFVRWRERPSAPLAVVTGLLAGVALLAHLLIVTAYPGLAVGVWAAAPRGGRARALGLFTLGGVAGCALFVGVAGLNPFLHPVYGKGGPLTLLEPPRATELVRCAAFTLYQFPFAAVLAARGAWRTAREDRSLALALGLVALGDVAFTLSFRVADQYVFYLPSYLVAALFVALGVRSLSDAWQRPGVGFATLALALVIAPPVLYALAPGIASRVPLAVVNPHTVPGRDNAKFFLDPPKRGEHSAETFARASLRVLPESALVVADWATLTPLLYLQQVEHARLDVALMESRPNYPQQLDSLVALGRHRRLFLADDDPPPYYDIDGYRRHFEIRPLGPLFMLLPR